MGEIKIDGYSCDRCEHLWISRSNVVRKPRVCPRCKSPYWNKPRRNGVIGAIGKEKKGEHGLFPSSSAKKKGFVLD